jgi:uncharacterized protein (DUF2141 family)
MAGAAASASGQSTEPAAVAGATLDLTIADARNARGMIRLCLTANPRHFPDCSGDVAARTLSIPAAQTSARFVGLPAGTYAVSLIHDENGNGRMDMTLVMPREGFGFSRNPRIGMGPPRFASAAFVIGTAAVHQDVRIRYML